VEAQFASHRAAAQSPLELAPHADAYAVEAITNTAFWASLKHEEGRSPKISLAFLPPEQARAATYVRARASTDFWCPHSARASGQASRYSSGHLARCGQTLTCGEFFVRSRRWPLKSFIPCSIVNRLPWACEAPFAIHAYFFSHMPD
jgi:hypothetical protein